MWLASRQITIDHTKISGSSKTNFPVGFIGTYPWLAYTGFGGKVTSPHAYDVAFFADAGLTTQLHYDRSCHDTGSGRVTYFVNVPTVSTASDSSFYIAYNNSTITTDLTDSVNVWDTNYVGVYHFNDIPGPTNGTAVGPIDPAASQSVILDASSYNYTDGLYYWYASASLGLSASGLFTSSVGQVGNALLFPNAVGAGGHAAQILLNQTFNNPTSTGSFSIEGWVSLSTGFSTSESVTRNVIHNTVFMTSGHRNDYWLEFLNTGNALGLQGALSLTIFGTDGSTLGAQTSQTLWTSGSQYYIAGTYDVNSLASTLYVNGAIAPLQRHDNQIRWTGDVAEGVADWGNANSEWWSGSMAEMRISTIARPADWYATHYANQVSPSTFYQVSNEIQATVFNTTQFHGSLVLNAVISTFGKNPFIVI